MDTQREIEQILDMLDRQITNDYKVTACHDNMLYIHSRKTENEYTIRVDEL